MMKLYQANRLGWMDIIGGFYTTRIMSTLFNVGLFDEMGKNEGKWKMVGGRMAAVRLESRHFGFSTEDGAFP